MAVVTVHDLVAALPEPAVLLERCRAFAALDAVFDPAGTYRAHTFEPSSAGTAARAWGETAEENHYVILFAPAGVFVHGHDEERDDVLRCLITDTRTGVYDPERLLEGLPASLAHLREDVEFLDESGDFLGTVCAWRETGDVRWRCAPLQIDDDEDDGADDLFATLLEGSAETYAKFAEECYFQDSVDREAVATILAGLPLTPEIAARLNPSADFAAIAAAVAKTGFPVQQATVG